MYQETFAQDQGAASRRAYVVRLRIKRDGKPDITGGLRFTGDAHGRMPGRNDAEKANAFGLWSKPDAGASGQLVRRSGTGCHE